MDHILQRVVGSSRISLLDGFSGYNKILVHKDDQTKTSFTTPWGTFIYVKMPFGLKNAGAIFQRAMDIAFAKEIHEFLVIYLDDITVFSKTNDEYLDHLRQVFIKYRKYGISPNPVLISPDYTKDFIIFSFASEHTIAAVLLQKNNQGFEQPIPFFSKALRDATSQV